MIDLSDVSVKTESQEMISAIDEAFDSAIDEVAEEFHRRQDLNGSDDHSLHSESDNQAYREASRRNLERFEKRFIVPLIELRSLATDCLIFANGYGYLIGCESQRDLVKRHNADPKSKANVCKYVKKYQRQLNLPPLPGQRDGDGCSNMRDSRCEQLKEA